MSKQIQVGWIRDLKANKEFPATVTHTDAATIDALSKQNQSLCGEILELNFIIDATRKKLEAVSMNLSKLGSFSSRIQNARHQMQIDELIESALVILSSAKISTVTDPIKGKL